MITLEDKQSDLDISKTKIFARHAKPGFQLIVYAMSIATTSKAAMILPIPVKSNSGEDAVRFIDMTISHVKSKSKPKSELLIPEDFEFDPFDPDNSKKEGGQRGKYLLDPFATEPDFFGELSKGCYPEYLNPDTPFFSGSNIKTPSSSLEVHEVGDYEASYIPSKDDFNRLDTRFRLEEEIWDKLPNYNDYGFVVFQLKTSLQSDIESVIPPMAFEFPTSESERLFFPTVHVHGSGYHREADYDHVFYCQRDNARSEFKYQRDLLKQVKPTPPTPSEFKYNREFLKQLELTPIEVIAEHTSLNDLLYSNRFNGYPWYYKSSEKASNVIQQSVHKGVIDPQKEIFAMKLKGKYLNKDILLGETA